MTNSTARPIWRLILAPMTHLALAIHMLISQIPGASGDYTSLANDSTSNYGTFINEQPKPGSDNSTIFADINNFVSTNFSWTHLIARGSTIRQAGSPAFCIGNLSMAIDGLGAATAASMSSASSLLTIMPTVGVLIGAPAKELWVLYKLFPLGGVISMLLSLGGSFVPSSEEDYKIEAFEYDTLMAAPVDEKRAKSVQISEADANLTEGERFANMVLARAYATTGTNPSVKICLCVLAQCVWIAVILVACYLVSSVAVIHWWCDFGGWAYTWYVVLATSSLLTNFAGVPFTKTWTIRVWRAPKVVVDPETPWVISPERKRSPSSPAYQSDATSKGPTIRASMIPRKPVASAEAAEVLPSPLAGVTEPSWSAHDLRARSSFAQPEDILAALEKGYNTTGGVWMDAAAPWSSAGEAFYVLLSVKGIATWHEALRTVSRVLSVGALAFGTGLFASATLVTIEPALIVLLLVLGSCIMGRATAMYMASEMIRNKPVIHRVVRSRAEAGTYLEAILRQPGVACEVLGHVIVQGRCVKRFWTRYWWLRWTGPLGILAPPFDLRRLATRGSGFVRSRPDTASEYLMQQSGEVSSV